MSTQDMVAEARELLSKAARKQSQRITTAVITRRQRIKDEAARERSRKSQARKVAASRERRSKAAKIAWQTRREKADPTKFVGGKGRVKRYKRAGVKYVG